MKFQIIFQNLVAWFLVHGIKVTVILVVAYIFMRLGKVFITKLIKTLIKKDTGLNTDKGKEQRKITLVKVFYSTLKIIIWAVAILTILPEFGINIGPLLAGAGVIGLAFGMGARSIINDYLSGIFIIIEDQYRVGEEVKIAGVQGKVLELNLRRTILQCKEGIKYSIPNGKITIVSNFSRITK